MMENGTKKIFEDLAKDIMEQAETLNTSLPMSDNAKGSLAHYNATNMELLTDRFTKAIIDLVGETIDLTGCGNLIEASDWKSNLQDELGERFLSDLRDDAEALGTYEDQNAEHRLGSFEYGLEAAE